MKKLLVLSMVTGILLVGCTQTNTQDESQLGVEIKPSNQQETLLENENQEDVVTDAQNENSNQSNNVDVTNTAYITENEAKTIVLNHAGVLESDVTFMKIELDYEKGVAEYEVDFYVGTTEYDYDVNASTGDIISYGKDLKNQSVNQGNDQTYITDETAKAIALEHAGISLSEATSIKVEFDFDKGIAEYEVEFKVGRVEYEYEINATTGEIISFEKDND